MLQSLGVSVASWSSQQSRPRGSCTLNGWDSLGHMNGLKHSLKAGVQMNYKTSAMQVKRGCKDVHSLSQECVREAVGARGQSGPRPRAESQGRGRDSTARNSGDGAAAPAAVLAQGARQRGRCVGARQRSALAVALIGRPNSSGNQGSIVLQTTILGINRYNHCMVAERRFLLSN